MRERQSLIVVFILIFIGAGPAWAQNSGAMIEERLAALERRMEQLEQENRDLRTQVALVVPSAAPRTVEVASASPGAVVAAVRTPTSPNALPASTGGGVVPAPPGPQGSAEKPRSDRIQIGGQIRFRAEVRQNADLRSAAPDLQDFVGQRMRFHIRGKISERVETFLEFQDSRLWGQEASTISNDNLTDLHQGYVQVTDFLSPGMYLRAGRQEFAYGAERLLGAFGWDNIGRSFDAVKMGYASKQVGIDWFAAKVVDRHTLVRGNDRDQYLYGMYSQFFRQKPQHLEVYGILFRDGQRAAGEIPTAGRKATELMTVGLHSDGTLQPGISYDLEFASQFGHRGFDPHSAQALAAKMYKTVEETHQLRLGFEYDAATGDSNPTDGRSGEFFNLFPTNHPYYGYADLMGWRNMQDFRPMFTVKPAGPLKFDIDYHRFYLFRERGPWKNAGGAVLGFDPTGKSGTHVGDEVDFTLAFPVYKHLKVLSGYSLFAPGEFAKKTRGSDLQHFFYLQTTVDF